VSKKSDKNHQKPDEVTETYAKVVVASYATYRVLDARKRAYEAFLYLFGDDLRDKA
jgi:hypothetical protein